MFDKIFTNKITFLVILPIFAIIGLISWLLFHENAPEMWTNISRLLGTLALGSIVGTLYNDIEKRDKSSKILLIIGGIAYFVLALFLTLFSMAGIFYFIVNPLPLKNQVIGILLTLFVLALGIYSFYNIFKQYRIYTGKNKNACEKSQD